MKCSKCGKSPDVAIHIEDGDPLIYCHDCRASERPEVKHKIITEHRLSRRQSKGFAFTVASKLTATSCLSIREEDLAGVDQSALDAISRVLEENDRLREENRKAVNLVQSHGRELRKSSDVGGSRVIDIADESEKAKMLTAMVEAELIVLVERVSREIGIDRKWVLSDIVYIATQRIRQIKDPS